MSREEFGHSVSGFDTQVSNYIRTEKLPAGSSIGAIADAQSMKYFEALSRERGLPIGDISAFYGRP